MIINKYVLHYNIGRGIIKLAKLSEGIILKVNTASNILKILLIVFAIGAIFFGTYILPIIAEQMAVSEPEVGYAKMPILITCQLLIVLLLIGIGIIMYLLVLFDRDCTFTLKFTKGLEVLVIMCIIASIGIMVLLSYTTTFGGPGPLLGLIMVGAIFIIWIVATVIMLIRAIVKKSIIYKNDYDLTV